MNISIWFRFGIFFVLSFAATGYVSADISQIAYIKASNISASDTFGAGGTVEGDAVALSKDGTTLAVGAPYESSSASGINGDQADESIYGAGAVYVYTQDDTGWVQQAYVKASNPGLTDNFGYMILLSADGNTMVVSAHFEASAGQGVESDQSDDSIPQAGAVYVFAREGEVWAQQAYLKASNTGEPTVGEQFADGDQFGSAIALSDDGNTLAISAITEDGGVPGINGDQSDNSEQSAGAVYLFHRDGSIWSQNAYVKPSNPGAGDLFGYALSLTADGQRLVIGSFDEDGSLAGTNELQDDEMRGSGAVYVFDQVGGAWQQMAYLKGANLERNDAMGVAVAISDDGNTIAATALDEDSMATGVNSASTPDWEDDVSTGAVYIYGYDAGTWTQQAYLKASNSGGSDLFGSRMALSGDGNTLAAAAQLEDSAAQGIDGSQDDNSADEAGAVYLFTRIDNVWAQYAYIKGSNTEEFDEFGSALSLSRDGSLLAVGAQYEDGAGDDEEDNSAFDSGAVYLFGR
jgi:hypothetical protein